ncbi:hypothetical protein SI65_04153 [Aspergillus cristatus]|uniref:Uncharacterized protein n=1 Tax=Aspergillus cristatus TaxID=573508 RepID=A0A1E3BJG3_ASPCR|nr:hypothetical protein SI65_04153 [Aspergillus cristatus]
MPGWKMHSVFCSTHGIAFLGTPLQPLHETSLTTLAEIVIQSIGLAKQKDIVNVLKSGFKAVFSDNPTNFDIMQEARVARKLLPIKVVCFYTELPVEGSNFVLTRGSATLPGCTSVGIHKNHMDMTKFATVDDSGFIAVRETLGSWIKEVDANGSSLPDTVNQYSGNNRQYNNFGEGKQMIVGGSHFETEGDQNFTVLSEK